MTPRTPMPERDQLDPVFRNSRRECLVILAAWSVCLIWTVGSYWYIGNQGPTESVPITLGMPSWVFWGVLMPWCMATTFSVVFSLVFMVDEPLGEGTEGPEETGFSHDVEKEASDG